MIAPLLLASLLAAGTAQSTGQMSPTSDVSGNRVKATGAATSKALRDHLATLPDAMVTPLGTTTPLPLASWLAQYQPTVVLYVSPQGNDANRCTSWALPCKTILAAWDKLPNTSDYPLNKGGQIVVAQNSEMGGVTAGQGLWISNYPEQAPVPAQWRKPKPVKITVVGSSIGAFTTGVGQGRVLPSGGSSWIGPVIWLSGTLGPILQIENWRFEEAVPVDYPVVDLNARWIDGTYSGVGGASAYFRAENCWFSRSGSGASVTAPTVDIGWFFWAWFNHSSFQNAYSGRTRFGDDGAASLRVARDDTAGYGGNLYFEDSIFNVGHVVLGMQGGPTTFKNVVVENLARSQETFTADGLTGTFTVHFPIPVSPPAPTNWEVDVSNVATTSYTVAPNANQKSSPGGTVTLTGIPSVGAAVKIYGPSAFFHLRSPDGSTRVSHILSLDNIQSAADAYGIGNLTLNFDRFMSPQIFSRANRYELPAGLDVTTSEAWGVQGSANGMAERAFIVGEPPYGYTYLPTRYGSAGSAGGMLWGRHDGAARAMPLVASRFANLLVASGASGMQSNFSATKGHAAPNGANDAYYGANTYTLYSRSDLSLSVGDSFLLTAWAKSTQNGAVYFGYSGTNLTTTTSNSNGVAVSLANLPNAWQIVKVLVRVLSVSASPQTVTLTLTGLQGNQPIELYRPTVVYVPAAVPQDELAELWAHSLPQALGDPGGGEFTVENGHRLRFWDATLGAWKYLKIDNGAAVIE